MAFSTLCVCFGTLAQAKSSLRSNPHPFTQEWIPGSTEKGVPQSVKGSVYVSSDGTYSYQEGTVDASAAAFGAYVDGVDNSDRPSGFGRLKITTNSTYEDKTQVRCAFLSHRIGVLLLLRNSHVIDLRSHKFKHLFLPVRFGCRCEQRGTWKAL